MILSDSPRVSPTWIRLCRSSLSGWQTLKWGNHFPCGVGLWWSQLGGRSRPTTPLIDFIKLTVEHLTFHLGFWTWCRLWPLTGPGGNFVDAVLSGWASLPGLASIASSPTSTLTTSRRRTSFGSSSWSTTASPSSSSRRRTSTDSLLALGATSTLPWYKVSRPRKSWKSFALVVTFKSLLCWHGSLWLLIRKPGRPYSTDLPVSGRDIPEWERGGVFRFCCTTSSWWSSTLPSKVCGLGGGSNHCPQCWWWVFAGSLQTDPGSTMWGGWGRVHCNCSWTPTPCLPHWLQRGDPFELAGVRPGILVLFLWLVP